MAAGEGWAIGDSSRYSRSRSTTSRWRRGVGIGGSRCLSSRDSRSTSKCARISRGCRIDKSRGSRWGSGRNNNNGLGLSRVDIGDTNLVNPEAKSRRTRRGVFTLPLQCIHVRKGSIQSIGSSTARGVGSRRGNNGRAHSNSCAGVISPITAKNTTPRNNNLLPGTSRISRCNREIVTILISISRPGDVNMRIMEYQPQGFRCSCGLVCLYIK